MRFKLYFYLENENFPIQYRKSIISFIKFSLSEYSQEEYNKLYHEKDCIIKPYTFAIFFRHPVFEKENIKIQDKTMELMLSCAEERTAIVLYNAINHQRNKKFSLYKNAMTLQNISMLPEQEIIENAINIRFMSPLVVRNRNQETKKDYYYSYQAKEFLPTLKINLKEQLKITNLPQQIIDTFSIEEIQGKKAIISFYEKKIECTLGNFRLIGDKQLLEYIYKARFRK